MILTTWIVLMIMSFGFFTIPLIKKLSPWKKLTLHSLAFFLFFAVTFLSFNLQVVTDAGIVSYDGSVYFRIFPFSIAVTTVMFIARDTMGVLKNAAED